MAMATFEDMEKAACCMLQIIKDTPELVKDTKVAIAGSMAMQYHLPKYTQDGAAVSLLRSCCSDHHFSSSNTCHSKASTS